MKKLNVFLALCVAASIANAQTTLSGTGSNSCGANSGTGTDNTSLGCGAGNSGMTGLHSTLVGLAAGGSLSTGSDNCAFGAKTMYGMLTGAYNTAYGEAALSIGTTGNYNNAVGYQSLFNNTANKNNSVGYQALYSNTSGSPNDAFGYQAMYSNQSGSGNTGFGSKALYSVTTASLNSGFGIHALQTATGGSNTAVGGGAGSNDATGTANVYLGYNTQAGGSGYTNAAAIGTNAVTVGSNIMQLGNSSLSGIYVNATYYTSDARFKTDIQENVHGLDFINKLRPVTYKLNTRALDDYLIQNLSDDDKASHKQGMDFAPSMAIIHSGFLAQEVEQAATQTGYNNSIVSHPQSSNQTYAVNYAEIVVPLVKAVQEQQAMINDLKNQVAQLTKNNSTPANSNSTTSINSQDIQLSDADVVVLNQNQPNPFAEQTVINYSIPQNASSAQILFYDLNGKQIKAQTINTKGKGVLNVYANDLSNGTYSYTLVVDGKVIDT